MNNIPAGYKQTEVGVIPEDWEVKELKEFVIIKSGESPSKYKLLDKGIPYYKVDQLNNSSKYQKETPYYVESCNVVPKGSLIFPKRGASILLNKIRILSDDSFMDTNLMTLTVSDEISNEYLYYRLLKTELWRIANTTSIPQINNKHINPLKIPIPPTKAEQTAIAAVLSDTDALINALDKLIAKKRLIKQGAMQELLSGKKRLAGFSGEWGKEKIKNLALITTGTKNTQDKIDDGKYLFFVRSQTIERINSYSFDGEAVLTAGDGVGTGKVFHYINGKFDLHQRVYKISNFSEQLDGYYFYLYFSNNFYNRIMQMTAKSSVDSVRMEMIADMLISLPPTKAEQTAISQILSDMDNEIQALESQHDKTQAIKQGMMQELLTGKTRLI